MRIKRKCSLITLSTSAMESNILLDLSIEAHKQSQIHWIKDINPSVEANIGFIETYADPLGVRAEFEGWVAVVDKDKSKKLGDLVANATSIIPELPWPKEFEKEKFQKPDFTSLEVVSYGCSGTPLGISLPNYTDIGQNVGFKNVNLGNTYPKQTLKTVKFITEEDTADFVKYYEESKFIQVALHELLGHGTGKIFTIDEKTGKPNFPEDLKDPFTNEAITGYYKEKETFESRFGHLHSAYEECRADTVAHYLSCYEPCMKILFPGRETEWDKILETSWLGVVLEGIRGLEYYKPTEKQWLQAHVNGRFVIMHVLLEAGQDFIKIEKCKKDDKDYMYIKIDKSKIKTVGKEAIGKFLNKLHIFKSLGDVKRGKELFAHYSEVNDEMIKLRDIVLMNKVPRRMELQGNVELGKDGTVKYLSYDKTFEGIVKSFVDRYDSGFDEDMYSYWKSCRKLYNPL